MVFDAAAAAQLRQVERQLDLSGRAARAKTQAAVHKAAFSVERGAKLRAPVDTGNLRNSINTSMSGTGIGSDIEAEVGPEANYGGFIELGTWKMAPQPYLGPAFDEVEPAFIAALQAIADETAS